jgi:predicted GIY-YIG superfamily endonuclease
MSSVTDTPQWHCYMLETCDGGRSKTYVGATVNPDRRLRQHNGEISGGARATSGRKWRRRYLIGGFADERAALRFEWRWKYLTRHAPFDSWQERRAQALATLLAEVEGLEILEGDGANGSGTVAAAEPPSTA